MCASLFRMSKPLIYVSVQVGDLGQRQTKDDNCGKGNGQNLVVNVSTDISMDGTTC